VKKVLTSALLPPVGACRFGCGTNCAAPVTVFWLFGMVSVVFGFFGGPTGADGISWATIGLGLAMWVISATWALLTMRGVEADRCHGALSPRDHKVEPGLAEPDPLDAVKKASLHRVR
jgi:hypothetical protein